MKIKPDCYCIKLSCSNSWERDMAFRQGNLLNGYRKKYIMISLIKFNFTSGFVKSNCKTGLAAVSALYSPLI